MMQGKETQLQQNTFSVLLFQEFWLDISFFLLITKHLWASTVNIMIVKDGPLCFLNLGSRLFQISNLSTVTWRNKKSLLCCCCCCCCNWANDLTRVGVYTMNCRRFFRQNLTRKRKLFWKLFKFANYSRIFYFFRYKCRIDVCFASSFSSKCLTKHDNKILSTGQET